MTSNLRCAFAHSLCCFHHSPWGKRAISSEQPHDRRLAPRSAIDNRMHSTRPSNSSHRHVFHARKWIQVAGTKSAPRRAATVPRRKLMGTASNMTELCGTALPSRNRALPALFPCLRDSTTQMALKKIRDLEICSGTANPKTDEVRLGKTCNLSPARPSNSGRWLRRARCHHRNFLPNIQ